MPDPDRPADGGEQSAGPSKSALKRRMHALQQLGETLTRLSDRQLQQIPIASERLRKAIEEARAIRSHSARRRHLQFIGKLMRDVDAGPIESALQSLDRQRQDSARAFHRLERLRDDILAAGPQGVELALDHWAQADRQLLRQLILQHQRETRQEKPPAASRRLFRYLRELQELYGAED
jgi:ribosome-associated protein